MAIKRIRGGWTIKLNSAACRQQLHAENINVPGAAGVISRPHMHWFRQNGAQCQRPER